jgi:hypothetical protein
MTHAAALTRILANDPLRMAALRAVRALALPDGWIGGGFVRDALWDHLHDQSPMPPAGDVDVLYFDPNDMTKATEKKRQSRLSHVLPALDWSVKNQARMHLPNGDAPYRDCADAMRHWPEIQTATAVRLSRDGQVEINAPFGLTDLFALRLAPGPQFIAGRRAIFDQRVREKRWLERYPKVTLDI